MAINPNLLAACRAVHIYLTMLGLLVMLLFGITGYTINHEDWFGALTPHVVEREGQVPPALIAQHDTLRIVEHLRQTFGIHGAMTDFSEVADEFEISFKEPGQLWDITIAKATGHVAAHNDQYNFVAVIDNLHRGRYAGAAWGWVIDFSAALIVLACATGFVLWLALPRRRQLGIAFLVLGTAATMAAIFFFVPGRDASPKPAPAGQAEQRAR